MGLDALVVAGHAAAGVCRGMGRVVSRGSGAERERERRRVTAADTLKSETSRPCLVASVMLVRVTSPDSAQASGLMSVDPWTETDTG